MIWSWTKIIIGSSHHIKIANGSIQPVTSACNLGVIVANDLNMDVYISNIHVYCSALKHALQNRLHQKSSWWKLTETLVHAFITCHLDRCNNLLYSLPDLLIAKLQWIQNSAARLVTRTRAHDHITPVLCNLHWLPVKYRIIYKILLLTCVFMDLLQISRQTISQPTIIFQAQTCFTFCFYQFIWTTVLSLCCIPIWNNVPNHGKGSRTGHSVKVSLWYASLLTNTRFRFLYFRISNC